MTERLGPEVLAELFLFEKLSDEQLAWLVERGEVANYEAGTTVYRVGEPATCLYVLLEGTLSMVMRAPGGEIEVNRTDHRGTYAGAFMAFLDLPMARSYSTGLRAVTDCRFWVLPAEDFGWAVREWFPMATHMLEGLAIQGMGSQQTLSTRERLVALGTVTAGLTHELNNPATAAARATATLAERLAGLWDELAGLAGGGLGSGQLAELLELVRQAVGGRGGQDQLSPLEASDREDELGRWLSEHGVPGAWDLAPPLVAAGVGTGWLDQVAATVPAAVLPHAVAVAAITCEAESLLEEVGEASGRISALIGAAKQYSQMDRSPLQQVDVHDGLESTLTMLKHKLETGIEVVRDYDRSLPKLPAYAGELNQVWTNLVDNAVDAMEGMDGTGRLTVRTAREGDHVLVEIGDNGAGVPEAAAAHVLEPFYTTKPVGKGTGLGLDICWRIVVQRHQGDLRFTSAPGDTRFQVLLPLTQAG
ncbi:MAG TPA: ATP-binding protein [Actinomycetota bacterium]|nr:ATP-binding protein [Actinomycetota bacterium]